MKSRKVSHLAPAAAGGVLLLATSIAWQYAHYGIKPVKSTVLTGPTLADKSNVKAAIEGQQQGAR